MATARRKAEDALYEPLLRPDVEQGAGDSPDHTAAGAAAAAAGVAADGAPVRRPLSLLPLIALIFFEVSGGPFGTEDAVAAAGPLLVIAGFIIFPLIWSVPEALITAELATAFPENSGYVAWVSAAFGPFWGFQEGWWSWLSGVTDNSIYPVMLADNLRLFLPGLAGGWQRTAFVVVLSLVLTYMNYRGLQVVGNAAMTTTIFIVAPFVLLCVFAAPHIRPANWLAVDLPSVQWGTYVSIMFWNLNYWDSVSCLAGEVDKPHKTFPRALLWAVLLVVASYLLPTMAALGVMPQAGEWELGFYGKVAQQVAGDWLALWVVAAAAASQVGQFQAEMSSDAFQLQGMAERGFLPKALARRSRHGTPTAGILLSSLGVCCLSFFDFVSIVELLNAIYCLAELLEFAAFVALRITAPNLPRPYRVPLPVWGLVMMLLPATVLLLAVLILPVFSRDWITVGATVTALTSGFALYPLLSWLRESGTVDFADLGFDFEHHVRRSPRPTAEAASPAGAADRASPGGMGGAAAAAAAAARRAGRVRGSYTIVASGALHYPGDDVYEADVFVDVASDGTGGRVTTSPERRRLGSGSLTAPRPVPAAAVAASGEGSRWPGSASAIAAGAAAGGGGGGRGAAREDGGTAGDGFASPRDVRSFKLSVANSLSDDGDGGSSSGSGAGHSAAPQQQRRQQRPSGKGRGRRGQGPPS